MSLVVRFCVAATLAAVSPVSLAGILPGNFLHHDGHLEPGLEDNHVGVGGGDPEALSHRHVGLAAAARGHRPYDDDEDEGGYGNHYNQQHHHQEHQQRFFHQHDADSGHIHYGYGGGSSGYGGGYDDDVVGGGSSSFYGDQEENVVQEAEAAGNRQAFSAVQLSRLLNGQRMQSYMTSFGGAAYTISGPTHEVRSIRRIVTTSSGGRVLARSHGRAGAASGGGGAHSSAVAKIVIIDDAAGPAGDSGGGGFERWRQSVRRHWRA